MNLAMPSRKYPRLSIWFWIFCPIQAYWIMVLVREAFEYKEAQADRRAATNAEKRIANRAIKVGRRETRNALHRINKLVAEQRSALQLAERRRAEAEQERTRLRTPKVSVDVIVIPPLTMADARSIIGQQRAKIEADTAQGDTRHLDAPSGGRRSVSYGLLTVDVAAIFIVFVKLFNIDLTLFQWQKVLPAAGFSIIAAGVLAQLAHTTGHLVWKWRVTTDPRPPEENAPTAQESPTAQGGATQQHGQVPRRQDYPQLKRPLEFPPRKAVLIAKLLGLFVVSVLSGFSILTRVVGEAADTGQPLIGWILGLLVACAAVAAPWLVVLDEMRSGSIESRTIDALTKMVQETEDASNTLLKSANRADQLADSIFLRGEGAANTAQGRYDSRRLEAENIILAARSLHASTGRYALDAHDIGKPPEDRDILAPLFALDTSQLYKALGRMRMPQAYR